MYIPKSQGKEARRVRQKRRLDFGDRARQGWLYGPCAACVTPPRPPPPRARPGAELRLTQLFLAGTPQDKIKAF